MDKVARQYEVFPYPERDPADEAKRLITGSPSDPVEIDHCVFAGKRNWRKPFRALVAGGGTGDGLVMLTQRLADIGCPAEVHYLDMSEAARAVAEARIAARGLSVTFHTADLLTAPDLGPFDYIDCCGVLHHLSDPDAGFSALAGALGPEGGMGLMVYAPFGRTGVYPLQDAFHALLGGDAPHDQARLAREALGALPQTNWFRQNPFLSDHDQSDAGLYDLLLHSRDRAYRIDELAVALDRAGLALTTVLEPMRYDPAWMLPQTPDFAERLKALDPIERMALAERLTGDLRTHIVYAAPAARAAKAVATSGSPQARPHLKDMPPNALAQTVAKGKAVRVEFSGVKHRLDLAREAAPALALVDGRRTVGEIAQTLNRDWMCFQQVWGPAARTLSAANLLRYSQGAR